jgi:hypothetical protein
MSRAQGLKVFLAALCLSAVAMDSAWAQDATPAPQAETAVSPEAQDGSQPGWLLRGRSQNRIVNPFRATPAPGTQTQQKTGPVPVMRLPPLVAPSGQLPPGNAIADAPGQGAGCSIGFRRQGTTCVPVQVPENASLDLTGHGWMCDRGFQRQGQGCVALVVPETAALDATGRRWACKYGFRREAQSCVAIVVPEHASLDKTGRAWTCNQGYERRDQGCIDDATARLQQQADKAVAARPGAAPASGSRSPVTINSGENRQGRTSKAKVVIGRF